MIFDDKSDTYTLTTGRKFYANNGIIGIDPDAGDDGMLAEGYDGAIVFDGRNADWMAEAGAEGSRWTDAERAEVADEMIRRWTMFKHAQVPHGTQ